MVLIRDLRKTFIYVYYVSNSIDFVSLDIFDKFEGEKMESATVILGEAGTSGGGLVLSSLHASCSAFWNAPSNGLTT
jgi:hypothetical protein